MTRFPLARSSLATFPAPQRQRGVVLIIALVMLLILTLIGVAGLRDTQLQERMAGGAQDRELALQAAETALREAEQAIASGSIVDSSSTAQYKNYEASDGGTDNIADLQRTNSGTPVTEAVYWRDVYDWTGNSGNNSFIVTTSLSGLSSQPLYVIERLPYNYSVIPDSWNDTGATTTGSTKITDYIITARGVGSTPDAVVILQSQYRDVYVYP